MVDISHLKSHIKRRHRLAAQKADIEEQIAYLDALVKDAVQPGQDGQVDNLVVVSHRQQSNGNRLKWR